MVGARDWATCQKCGAHTAGETYSERPDRSRSKHQGGGDKAPKVSGDASPYHTWFAGADWGGILRNERSWSHLQFNDRPRPLPQCRTVVYVIRVSTIFPSREETMRSHPHLHLFQPLCIRGRTKQFFSGCFFWFHWQPCVTVASFHNKTRPSALAGRVCVVLSTSTISNARSTNPLGKSSARFVGEENSQTDFRHLVSAAHGEGLGNPTSVYFFRA